MKIFNPVFSLIVFFAFVAVSCKNSDPEPVVEEPEIVDLITINAAPGAFPYSDIWFVVWDSTGNVLAQEKFTAGEELILTTTDEIPGNKISVGYLRHFKNSSVQRHMMTIFTDLAPGVELIRGSINPLETTGEFRILLSNKPEGSELVISNKFGGGPNYGQEVGDKEEYDCEIHGDGNRYILTLQKSPGIYYEINDVENNDELEVDVSDFKPFENELTINLPPSYLTFSVDFKGFDPGLPLNYGGYSFDYNSLPRDLTTYTTGYLSSINKFGLALSAEIEGGRLIYQKIGDLPTAIEWPDPAKYIVNSYDPGSFSATANGPVQFITASWYTSSGTDYRYLYIASPQLEPKVWPVPPEILQSFPGFAAPAGGYDFADIMFQVEGTQTYPDFADRFFISTNDEIEYSAVVKTKR